MQVTVGFLPSFTVNGYSHAASFPQPSVALKQICVTPNGKCAPATGPCVCVTVTLPTGQVLVAVGRLKP